MISRAKRRKLRYGAGGTVRYRLPDNAGGGIHTTGAEQAHAYVATGRAKWGDDGILVFLELDHRCIAAAKSRSRPRLVNGDGFATLEGIAGLPCIQPIKLLFGKRPAVPPRDYPETVEISRRLLA